MKKIKILLLAVLYFVGIGSASAITENQQFYKTVNEDTYVTGLTYSYSGGSYAYENYYYSFTSSESSFKGYCLDPQKDAGNLYKVDRILGDDDYSDIVRAYDYGSLEILSKGYNEYNTSGYGVSGDNFYNATSIALRAFLLGLYSWGTTGTTRYVTASAIATLGAQWAGEYSSYASIATGNCSSSSDATSCFISVVQSSYSWYNSSARLSATSGSAGESVLVAAKSLFLEGVQAAADYMQNGRSDSSITYSVGKEVQVERSDNVVTSYLIIDLTVTNFPEEGEITDFMVTPTTNGQGITIDSMEYSVDGVNYTTLTSGMDVSQDLETVDGLRNGTIKIKLNFTKEVNEDCSDMSFTLVYYYNDPTKEWQGAILKEVNATSTQRFLIVEKLSAKDYSQGIIEITGGATCIDYICETTISVPICSDDEEEAISEINAPSEIKKCIIDNVDDAGNSYQLTEINGGVSNDYCEVFCKEDYKDVIEDGVQGGIKLNPIVVDVNCGGYFQLTSHIEGEKDCYTGGDTDDKSIDKEQFLEDLQNAQKAMIIAQGFKDAIEEISDTTAFANTYMSTSGGYECSYDEESTCYTIYYTIRSMSITLPNTTSADAYQVTSSVQSYSLGLINEYTSEYTDLTASEVNSLWNSAASTYSALAEAELISAMKSELSRENVGITGNSPEAVISTASDQLEQVIKDYNGCTSAWTMEFNLSPTLKYYYNEYRSDGTVSETYYSLLQYADEELQYLELVEDSVLEEYEFEICTGTTNEEYECESGSYVYDDWSSFVTDEWNVITSLSSSEIYTEQAVTICDGDSCYSEPMVISNATFVRKSIKKSQDYITPTVYYQDEATGRVVVLTDGSTYTGNIIDLGDEQTGRVTLAAIENGLPIATNTVGGGVYQLAIADLGEFYDTGELGRLIDFEGDHESESVAANITEIEVFDGNYICYYESPCRSSDCPDCDFVCDVEDATDPTDPEICEFDFPDVCIGEYCEWEEELVDCPNCIFNYDESQLNIKVISTSNVTSAERTYGYNWDVTTTLTALQLLRAKATETIEQIETDNETIYSKEAGEDNGLAFSIVVTSEIIEYLLQYNEDHESEGGYANASLSCQSAEVDGITVANLFCYSEVIDELLDKYGDQIEGLENRSNATSYWTTWSGWLSALDLDGDGEIDKKENGQNAVIGGPAWK